MLFRLSPTFLAELRRKLGKPLPNGTGTAILMGLSPLLEGIIEVILERAQRELEQENELRKVQKTLWTLRNLKERHIQVAAFNVAKCLKPYLDMGGEERSERISSQSPSNENNPYEG